MFFLPHSTDLKLAQRPYVTYGVILLCILIHYLQEQSRDEVWHAAERYCELINYKNDGRSIDDLVDIVPMVEQRELDYLRANERRCRRDLDGWHAQPNKENIRRFIERRYNLSSRSSVEEVLDFLSGMTRSEYRYTQEELAILIAQAQAHYNAFAIHAPRSMDERLMYDPATPNPLRMISSSLAHGDWWHIIFNLIFFFAFAPALELLCLHWLRYVGVLVGISFATSISYSLFSIGSIPIPSLGLSGVVMGMMGLSAYMMPRARIRTLLWLGFYARNFYIPAWILAAFYIGSDIITLLESGNRGGVNVVAHVSGGIAGYLIGRFWLRQQKEDTRELLEEEMEERRAVRNDRIGDGSTTRAGQQRIFNQMREYEARRGYQAWMDRLHALNDTEQHSEAIAHLLARSDDYASHPELYDELFEEALKWRHGRVTLCLGRLDITLLLKQGRRARALEVVRQCQAITPAFVLSDPKQNGVLLREALVHREYALAYQLLHDASERYGEHVDCRRYRYMEAQLLTQHLKRYDEARALLTVILAEPEDPYRERAQKMADYIGQMA